MKKDKKKPKMKDKAKACDVAMPKAKEMMKK